MADIDGSKEEEGSLLKEGLLEGCDDGSELGTSEGIDEGLLLVLGSEETDGLVEDSNEGLKEGSSDGINEGLKEGSSVGESLGIPLGPEDGDGVNATVGFFEPQPFPNQPFPAHASPPELTTQEEGPFPDHELSQEVGFSVGLGPQPPPQDQFQLFPSQFHLPSQALTGLFVGLLQSFQALSALCFFFLT